MRTQIDVTEASTTNLSTDTVLITDTKILTQSALFNSIRDVCKSTALVGRRGWRTIVVMVQRGST